MTRPRIKTIRERLALWVAPWLVRLPLQESGRMYLKDDKLVYMHDGHSWALDITTGAHGVYKDVGQSERSTTVNPGKWAT